MLQDLLNEYQHLLELNEATNGAYLGEYEPYLSDEVLAAFESTPATPADSLCAPLLSPDSEDVAEENISPQIELPNASDIFTSVNPPNNSQSQSQSQFQFSFQPSAQPISTINPYSTHTHHPTLHSIPPVPPNSQVTVPDLAHAVSFLRSYVKVSGIEKRLSPVDELNLAKKASTAPDPRFHRPDNVEAQATRGFIADLEKKAKILQHNLNIKQEARASILSQWTLYYTKVEKQNLKTYTEHKDKILEETRSDMSGVKSALEAVTRELGQRNAMLSPIRRLGTDELLYVFEACIANADVGSGEDPLTKMFPKKPKAGDGTPKSRNVFNLMQVCSLWRRNLLTMPSAWRDISLFPPNVRLTGSDYVHRLYTYCQRAGALTINVTISPLYLPRPNDTKAPKPKLSQEEINALSAGMLLGLMGRIPVSRWKTLRVLHGAKFPFGKLIMPSITDATNTPTSEDKDDDKDGKNDGKEDKDISKDPNNANNEDTNNIKPTFSKLHALLITDPPTNPSVFFDWVAKTSRNLQHLQISTNPLDRNDSPFLTTYKNFGNKLLTLRTVVPHVEAGRLYLPNTLTTLHFNFLPDRRISLPHVKKLELQQSCDLLRLRDFELPSLTHLKCQNFYYSQPGPGVTRIHMPSLVSLIVTGTLSPGLAVLSAPNLEELYIERSEGSSKENKWNTIKFLGTSSLSDDTNPYDVNDGSWASLSATHNIRPTKLTLNTPLSTEQIISVLTANPQLTDFTVSLDKHVKWRRKLKDILCQVKRIADGIVTGDGNAEGVQAIGGLAGPSGNTRGRKQAKQSGEDEKDDKVCALIAERPKRELEICPLLAALTFSLDFGDLKETRGVKTTGKTNEEAYELDTWKAVTSMIIQTRSLYGPPLTITCKWKGGKVMVYGAEERKPDAAADESRTRDNSASLASGGENGQGPEHDSDED